MCDVRYECCTTASFRPAFHCWIISPQRAPAQFKGKLPDTQLLIVEFLLADYWYLLPLLHYSITPLLHYSITPPALAHPGTHSSLAHNQTTPHLGSRAVVQWCSGNIPSHASHAMPCTKYFRIEVRRRDNNNNENLNQLYPAVRYGYLLRSQ